MNDKRLRKLSDAQLDERYRRTRERMRTRLENLATPKVGPTTAAWLRLKGFVVHDEDILAEDPAPDLEYDALYTQLSQAVIGHELSSRRQLLGLLTQYVVENGVEIDDVDLELICNRLWSEA
jgi:hypothetical protein